MIKKTVAIFSALLMLLTTVACGSEKKDNEDNVDVQTLITTASASEKILRDEEYSGNPIFQINAFKNEYESAQIIIRPNQNVEQYDIVVEDFIHENSTDSLSKDLFEVYHEKYIKVNTIKNTATSLTSGEYPDALLPFATAKEYKENCIAKDTNQAVWIAIKVPKEAKAGVYSGNIKVIIDEKTNIVPAKIQVYNYAIGDENHVKSSYGIYQDEIARGELDSSDEMFEKYVDFFLDFRLSPQHLPTSNSVVGTLRGTVGDAAYEEQKAKFIEMAIKYTKDVRCSNFNIPVQTVSATYPDGTQNTGLNTVTYRDYLIDMAKASVRENVNLFAKAGTYLIYFDEAVVNGKMNVANYNLKQINEVHELLGEELLEILQADEQLTLDGKEAFVEEVIEGMKNVKHKLVGSYTDLLEEGIKCQYVPTIDQYNTETNRNLYEDFAEETYGENGELWSYHCMNPYAPNPTVHIDDYLLSSRLMGWMMANYNIVGSLYWDVTLYSWRQSSVGDLQLQDYYDTALRFPQANGDGFLVYPGRPYGPVASVRLWSLRDGFEDYELLYALKQTYLEQGYSADDVEEIVDILVDKLYSGTKVIYTNDLISDFGEARETLAQLLDFAQNGVFIDDIAVNDNSVILSFAAKEGTRIYDNTGAELDKDGDKYTETVALENAANYLQITCVNQANDRYPLKMYVGAKRSTIGLNEVNSITTCSKELTKNVDESSINISGSTLENAYIDMKFGGLSIEGVSVIEISVYSSESMTVKLMKNGQNSMGLVEYDNITLAAGMNTLRIDINALGLDSVGGLNTIRMRLQSEVDEYELEIQKVILVG